MAPASALPVLPPSAQASTGLPPSPPGLTVQSGTVTNVSSLLVETESITAVPSLASPEPPQPLPHTVEINPPDIPTLTPASDPVSVPPLSSAAPPLGGSVTGTGSVTATPSAYTTAVMTTATTTTTITPGQLLGKRVRRQSSKYEDYEQQTLSAVRGDKLFLLVVSVLLQKTSPGSPVVPDVAAKAERKTTNQLQFLLKATRALWRHHYAWPFHKPVDPVALSLPVSATASRCEVLAPLLQDYFLIVKRPVDMGAIKKNLENCVYDCAKECIQDYRQMFNNCYLYNKPTDVRSPT